MRRHITTILLFIILLAGLGLLFYPSVSNWWNERISSRAISTYDESVADLTDEEYEKMIEAAENYNTRLSETGVSAFYNPDLVEGYEDAIDITGTGIMGYISIEKINVQLPIYHGTSVDVLQVAAGHLEGTSLPVGGESTHAVIMAHRGLPSAMLFTDLNELVVGDTFTITVLNRVLTYEVDLISIVEPNDVSLLQIEEGEDLVTLLTCTPYGVNTHRLLVRGHRIETEAGKSTATATGEASIVNRVLVSAIVAVVLLIPLLLWVFLRPVRKKRKSETSEEDLEAARYSNDPMDLEEEAYWEELYSEGSEKPEKPRKLGNSKNSKKLKKPNKTEKASKRDKTAGKTVRRRKHMKKKR